MAQDELAGVRHRSHNCASPPHSPAGGAILYGDYKLPALQSAVEAHAIQLPGSVEFACPFPCQRDLVVLEAPVRDLLVHERLDAPRRRLRWRGLNEGYLHGGIRARVRHLSKGIVTLTT